MPGSDGGMTMYAAGMSGLLTGLPSLRCLFRRPAAEDDPGFNRQPSPVETLDAAAHDAAGAPVVGFCMHGLQN